MVYSFAGPNDWIVVLLVLAAIAALVLWGVWRAIGALCRRNSWRRRTKVALFAALVAAAGGTGVALSIDRLDALERICEAEVRKHPRLAQTSELEIKQHLNYWKQHTSSMWGIQEPWKDPKVTLTIHFLKEGKKHQSRLECRYRPIPDSGQPPRLAFQSIQWSTFDMLEQNRWVPAN